MKRANGEGSAPFPRSDGKWQAAYTDAAGKRRTIKRATRALVQEALIEATGKSRAGELPLPAKLTVSAWLSTWMTVHMTHLAKRSIHNYTQVIDDHINPVIGSRLLNGPERLSSVDVTRMLNDMADKGLSETMRQHTYGILNAALKQAANSEPPLIARNPLVAVPRPGRDTEPTTPWTDEQTAAFRDSIVGDRLEGMWTVALLCGLRQGELVGLRWTDVTWTTPTTPGTITVAGQLDRFTHQWYERKGKGKVVVIEMPADVEDLLRARETAQKREQLKAGPKWAGNLQNLVFTTRHGTPIPHNNVGGSWRVAVARVDGLPYMKPHGTRHYTASYQTDGGASVAEVAAMLGQDDRTVTRTYIHLTHRSRSAAAERANALPRRLKEAQ